MPEVDPVASMRMWAVDANLAGKRLHIPPLPAADWLPALMANDLGAILDLADTDPTLQLLADGEITVEELSRELRDVIAAATGRSAHAALNIAVTSAARWDIVGRHVARTGVRFDRIPIGMALDLLYDCCLNNMDDAGRAAFEQDLQEAPTKEAAVKRFTAMAGKPVPPANAEQYAGVRPKTRRRTPQPPQDGPTDAPTPPPDAPAVTARRTPTRRASGRTSPDHPVEPRPQAS